MTEITLDNDVARVVARADDLMSRGDVHGAIALLTEANRAASAPELERALVRVRRDGCRLLPVPSPPRFEGAASATDPGDGTLLEVDRAGLTSAALRKGMAQSGCLLVRGLLDEPRVARFVAGIDAAFAGEDAFDAGEPVDPRWFDPFGLPDVITEAEVGTSVVIHEAAERNMKTMSERMRRKFLRSTGGVWTAYSPRMVFELCELVDDAGLGQLMTDYLGERPVMSANKCTLRRVPPSAGLGGWHQDGSFLSGGVGAFNIWIALTDCGRDAPGLDVVPRRIDDVLVSDDGSHFDWSLSDEAVARVASPATIIRPEFRAGDALLFDHLFVHRTAALPEMTNDRYAMECWFFTRSAYPEAQLPLVY
jgi:hypothetical protein